MKLKDMFASWQESYDKPSSILKRWGITLPREVYIFKAMVFPVIYGCESYTMIKDKHEKIDAFKLWCQRRLLRVPWTTRRSNQSILKKISPEYSLEGLMLKLQYFGHLMWRANSLEKILTVGTTEGKRRRKTEDEMVGWYHWLNGHELEHTPGESEGQGSLARASSWGWKESDTP